MKFFFKRKDGGPESRVTGYWLFESKRLGSICLLKFEDGSRDAYHSHAFNSINWIVKGRVAELELRDEYIQDKRLEVVEVRKASWRPWVVVRNCLHRVYSFGTTWVLSFRGPWAKTWKEYIPATGETITLTSGRKRVD